MRGQAGLGSSSPKSPEPRGRGDARRGGRACADSPASSPSAQRSRRGRGTGGAGAGRTSTYRFCRWGSTGRARTPGPHTPSADTLTPRTALLRWPRSGTAHTATPATQAMVTAQPLHPRPGRSHPHPGFSGREDRGLGLRLSWGKEGRPGLSRLPCG